MLTAYPHEQLRIVSRGEQGRPEDEAAEAAETGTATPARSLATAPIPEHPPVQSSSTGPSAADLSSLAGADVSLMHGGTSPQLADRDLPVAYAGGSIGPNADASSLAELSGSNPSLATADPSTGVDTAAGPAGGTATAGHDGPVLGGGPNAAAEARNNSTSVGGAETDVRRSVTFNPLFEPEARDDGTPSQRASSPEPSAEPVLRADNAGAAAAASASDSVPGALQSSSSHALGEGSGHVRVRQRGSEAHPSILRRSTWTDPDATASAGSAADRLNGARPDGN